MTIIYTDGDILRDPAEAIVIPVNTMGVPGAGLAKAWAKKDPDAAGIYKALCEKGLVKVGEINIIITAIAAGSCSPPRNIGSIHLNWNGSKKD